MSESLLPEQFSELESFAPAWCLGTESERWTKRMESTMTEMQAFYDAAFPRIEEALVYCDKFPLADLPDEAQHLLDLVHSTIMVAMCIEIWHQPEVVNGGHAVMTRTFAPRP